jgi:uncharacterized protein (TIGR00725 family)
MAYLGISGPSRASAQEYDDARHLGAWAAEHGHVVVCGGLGGVMEGGARGAREAGGVVIGLLPGSDRSAANPYVTAAIPTGMGEMRNALLVRASDVLLVVGGSWGTLSELALAARTGVPVVALDSWSLPDDPDLPGPRHVTSVAEACATLATLLRT